MSDKTSNRGPRHCSRVSTSDDYELTYWTEKFGVSPQQLQEAVDAVGDSAAAVEEYLR